MKTMMVATAFILGPSALSCPCARAALAAPAKIGVYRSTRSVLASVSSSRRLHVVRMGGSATPEGYARESQVRDGSASPLSEQVKALIAAQISHPIFDTTAPSAPACTVAAQNSKPPRFLTAEECAELGSGGRAAGFLRDSCNEIVSVARRQVRITHPGIDEPGGALYPSFRAEACWRDLTNFVRVASYGCVCMSASNESYLSAEGCEIMNMLYSELEVPRLAMLTGVRACSDSACDMFGEKEEEPKHFIKRSFKVLFHAMSTMGEPA